MSKYQISKIVFFFILIFQFNLLQSNENKILVIVDAEPITSYELKNKILTQLIMSNQVINQQNIDQSKKSTINYLINLKIKKNEILSKKIEVSSENLNQTLNRISGNDIENFKKKFKNNSIDYDLFIEEIKIELAWQQLIYSLFRNNIKIEDSLIENELSALIKKEQESIEYRLSEIELEIQDIENQKIKSVMRDIENIGFEAAANKHSISATAINNGDLGWINAKILSNQMLSIVENLNLNEVSKPIKRLNKLLILMVKDKRKFNIDNKNLDEVRNKLINQKANELFKLYSNNHLSKIKNSAFIRFK
tara:strand:+ start:25 stop:948 length:924 start_codon:yes stop_codon:yes gene_type:complete